RWARGSSVETIVGLPAGVTARTVTATGWPPRRIVALPDAWIVHRFSVGPAFAAAAALAGGGGAGMVDFSPDEEAACVSFFCSEGVIPPSTRVPTTPGSPRTTRTESSGTVSVRGSAVLKSMTSGGWPAEGGGGG